MVSIVRVIERSSSGGNSDFGTSLSPSAESPRQVSSYTCLVAFSFVVPSLLCPAERWAALRTSSEQRQEVKKSSWVENSFLFVWFSLSHLNSFYTFQTSVYDEKKRKTVQDDPSV
jgi:hypothetical protein